MPNQTYTRILSQGAIAGSPIAYDNGGREMRIRPLRMVMMACVSNAC